MIKRLQCLGNFGVNIKKDYYVKGYCHKAVVPAGA